VITLAISNGSNRAGVSLPSCEGGKNFRNVVFSNYLEFQKMCGVHKPSDSQHEVLFKLQVDFSRDNCQMNTIQN
jgi:hypothetical protein